MPLHSSLTGTELHENKGAASASDNTVASATTGATVWRKVNTDMIDTSSIFNTNITTFQTVLTDVSTAETVYIPVPFDCTVLSVYAVLQGAITVADSILDVKNDGGASMGTLTIAFTGSSAGTLFSFAPTTNNTFTTGQRIQVSTDGGSTTTQKLFITLGVEFT